MTRWWRSIDWRSGALWGACAALCVGLPLLARGLARWGLTWQGAIFSYALIPEWVILTMILTYDLRVTWGLAARPVWRPYGRAARRAVGEALILGVALGSLVAAVPQTAELAIFPWVAACLGMGIALEVDSATKCGHWWRVNAPPADWFVTFHLVRARAAGCDHSAIEFAAPAIGVRCLRVTQPWFTSETVNFLVLKLSLVGHQVTSLPQVATGQTAPTQLLREWLTHAHRGDRVTGVSRAVAGDCFDFEPATGRASH